MDPQGKGDRILFARKGMKGAWPIQTRNKESMIATVQNVVIDDRFAVDADACPMFCEEVEVWQKDSKTGKELDEFNHAMAAWRYGIANAEVVEGKRPAGTGAAPQRTERLPHSTSTLPRVVRRAGPVHFTGSGAHPTDQFQLTR
jgi:hypothetical protein